VLFSVELGIIGLGVSWPDVVLCPDEPDLICVELFCVDFGGLPEELGG
jgi:hypothetical protein